MSPTKRARAVSLDLDAEEVAALARRAGGVLRADDAPWLGSLSDRELRHSLPRLLPAAAALADASISSYKVGAIAVCGAGAARRLYFGANLEIAGAGLSSAVHAEQSAIVNAWMHDAQAVSHLAVSSPPCGYCRQFLYELAAADSLEILWRAEDGRATTRTLGELLPDAFGPEALGGDARLLGPAYAPPPLVLAAGTDRLRERALEAASRSYAPYTLGRAGCALETSAKRVFVGRYVENAAYNPSLTAMQTALAMMSLAPKLEDEKVVRAVLVERRSPVAHLPITEYLLRAVAPGVAVESFEAAEPGRA